MLAAASRLLPWAMAALVVVVVARYTAIGPALHLGGGHGVHLGDVAAAAVCHTWLRLREAAP